MGYSGTIYGLKFYSDELLDYPGFPSLPTSMSIDDADVVISVSRVPTNLPNSQYHGFVEFTSNEALVNLQEFGRFLISNGNRVTIQFGNQESAKHLFAHLFVSGLSMLLMQRKRLILHGSCVQYAGEAVAFLGDSGSGKSVAAATMCDNGYSLVSDDNVVPFFTDDGVLVETGPQYFKLQRHLSVAQSQYADSEMQEVWNSDKLLLPPRVDVVNERAHLRRIFLLAWRHPDAPPKCKVQKLDGFTALETLTNQVFRHEIYDLLGRKFENIKAICELLNRVEVYSISRPRSTEHLNDFVSTVSSICGEL